MKFGDPSRARSGIYPSIEELPLTTWDLPKALNFAPDQRNRSTQVSPLFGLPVWSDRNWIPDFYPMGTRASDMLRVLSEKVGCVEVNSTYYKLVAPAQVNRWVESVNPTFRFLPKIYRGISQGLNPEILSRNIDAIFAQIDAFQDRLGCALLQLPATLRYDSIGRLEFFLVQWSRRFPVGIEFRHPSWFENGQVRQDVAQLLATWGASTVVSDTPGERGVIHTTWTGPHLIVRFLSARPFDDAQPTSIDWSNIWKEIDAIRIRNWVSQRSHPTFWVAHSPNNIYAPELLLFSQGHFKC